MSTVVPDFPLPRMTIFNEFSNTGSRGAPVLPHCALVAARPMLPHRRLATREAFRMCALTQIVCLAVNATQELAEVRDECIATIGLQPPGQRIEVDTGPMPISCNIAVGGARVLADAAREDTVGVEREQRILGNRIHGTGRSECS